MSLMICKNFLLENPLYSNVDLLTIVITTSVVDKVSYTVRHNVNLTEVVIMQLRTILFYITSL